jgi:hypothetical protein
VKGTDSTCLYFAATIGDADLGKHYGVRED